MRLATSAHDDFRQDPTLEPRHAYRIHHGVSALSAESLNRLTSEVISAAIEIHRTFGPGLFESAYLACLAYDLRSAGLLLEMQKAIPLEYHGVRMNVAYRADMMVEGVVLVEVKALDVLAPNHTRQLRTYLRLAKCPVGLLLNFGAPTMTAGIKRVVNEFPDS